MGREPGRARAISTSPSSARPACSYASGRGNTGCTLPRVAGAHTCVSRSGARESRQRLQTVGFEQFLQLRSSFLGSLDELSLVVLDRVLRIEPLLVVLLEQAHGALRGGDSETQGKQRVPRHVQARRKGFAPDELDAEVAQPEQ